MNPSTRNMKKTTPKYIITKLVKTNDKKTILKAARRKSHFKGNKGENSIRFLFRNKVKEKPVEQRLESTERKTAPKAQNSIPRENTFQK